MRPRNRSTRCRTAPRRCSAKIEEPVTLDLYFSEDADGLPIAYKNYAARVQEMLRQYVRASGGKLTLNVINPRPDTPEEEKATASGLTPQVAQQGGEQFFFGLVVTQADQQKTIPAFTPQREQFLEYDLSKLVYSVQQLDKRKLGLLTSLPLQGTNPQEMQMMMMMRRQPQPSQMVISELEQSFEVVRVEPTATELPAGLDALSDCSSAKPSAQAAVRDRPIHSRRQAGHSRARSVLPTLQTPEQPAADDDGRRRSKRFERFAHPLCRPTASSTTRKRSSVIWKTPPKSRPEAEASPVIRSG